MKRILIVDDEKDIAEVIGALLAMEGYDVIKAANGRVGLEQARGLRPDLLLVDIMMPIMSGPEMVEELGKDAGHEAPVILMSAGGGSEEARRLGCEFIQKPFDFEDLLALIRRLLASPG